MLKLPKCALNKHFILKQRKVKAFPKEPFKNIFKGLITQQKRIKVIKILSLPRLSLINKWITLILQILYTEIIYFYWGVF